MYLNVSSESFSSRSSHVWVAARERSSWRCPVGGVTGRWRLGRGQNHKLGMSHGQTGKIYDSSGSSSAGWCCGFRMPGMGVRSDSSFSLTVWLVTAAGDSASFVTFLVSCITLLYVLVSTIWKCLLNFVEDFIVKKKKLFFRNNPKHHFSPIIFISLLPSRLRSMIYSLVTSWRPQLFLLAGEWPASFACSATRPIRSNH